MADEQNPATTGRAPLLIEPVAPVEDVPVLVDAVLEDAAPVLEAPAVAAGEIPPATVAALRDTLTVLAAELARRCLDEVLEEARMTLQHRLTSRLEDELGAVIERALRDQLASGD
jgi:hypothetical protein